MSTNTRLLIAAIILAIGPAGTYVIREKITPTETRPAKLDLRELPVRLGSWTGEGTEADPKIFADSHYDSAVNFVYRNPKGDNVLIHTAIGRRIDRRFPHHPTICYTVAGFEITSEKEILIERLDGSSVPARLLTVQRDGQRECVLYWYQMGDAVYFDAVGKRRVFWDLRFTRSWPPHVKVMLQTAAADPAEARALLESVAVPLFEWIRQL